MLRHGCGIEFLRNLPADSVDLLLTDPPYEGEHQHLFGEMALEAARVLKVGASLVTLCGHHQVLDVGADIKKHLRFWWVGGMLHTTLKRLPGKWVCIQGNPALWFVRERRKTGDTQCPIDFMQGGGKDKRFHAWGQPVYWFQHWVERLTEPGDLVVDPFLGGGAVGAAALLSGRVFAGAEIDTEAFGVAQARLRELSNGC